MKTLLTLAISIAIFCDPLYTNGSPLQSDSDGIEVVSNYSYATVTAPDNMDYQEIESILGVSPNKDGLFRIDDVYFTTEEIKKNFGIGLGGKNGQPDESKRWPKGKKYPFEECQSVELILSGGALAELGSRQGVYVKAAKENGKLSWTKGSHALWWAPNGWWMFGNKVVIGSDLGFFKSRLGLPYSSLSNQWEYWDGNDWVKPINEITVNCTSLETVGKVSCGNHQEDSCADCPQGNGETWCNGDCKWVNGNCLSKVNGTMPVVIDASVTDAERSQIVDQMHKFNLEMSGCLQLVWECQHIYVTLAGGALAAHEHVQGLYVKNVTVNGKPSWTGPINSTLWWGLSYDNSGNGNWIIGPNTLIGTGLFSWLYSPTVSGLPQGNGNEFFYRDGAAWVKPINEITIESFQSLDCTTITDGDYVEIQSHDENTDPNGDGGCYSSDLGRTGDGKQIINLERAAFSGGGTCMTNGTIIHELIHAWGFWHEQTRPDRDNFVKIIENNIQSGKESQFWKRNGSYTFDVPYDGGSVMHYPSKAFGIKVGGVYQTTIEPLPTYNFDPSEFGQRVWMSPNDAMKLKKMYMCEPRGGGEFFGPSGVVNSPEWPREYSNFADSYLKITCDSGEKVNLQFLTFDIEDHPSCQHDWLSITDTSYGDPQAGPYCGSTKPPNYLSASNYTGVYFRSDGIQTAAGFEIKYTCIKDNVSNCKDKKPEKKCKKLKKKGKCKKKKVAKKCKKTCGKC